MKHETEEKRREEEQEKAKEQAERQAKELTGNTEIRYAVVGSSGGSALSAFVNLFMLVEPPEGLTGWRPVGAPVVSRKMMAPPKIAAPNAPPQVIETWHQALWREETNV